MKRREFLQNAAGAALATAVLGPKELLAAGPWKFSMYQGSLRMPTVEVFERARRIGLDGVEPLMGSPKDGLPVRRPEVRQQYKEAAARAGVTISSVCINALNSVPLKSEPKTAIWLLQTIEAAHDFGCKNILVPFFGKGELKLENTEEIDRALEALQELAPFAQKAGVTLGLENTLSADDNLKLIERVNSPAVRVYYDIGNSFSRGRDVPAEIRKLGSRQICQIHVKDNPSLLGQGKMDLAAVAAAVRDIDYNGWLVLETESPSGDVEQDTKTNLAFARKVFA